MDHLWFTLLMEQMGQALHRTLGRPLVPHLGPELL
jgi:hypothetical protein